MTQFGARVVGREAYDKAVRETKGGGNVFGKRVRDAIPENGPVGEKKRATEHGALVVDQASASGPDGKGSGVSIEQLRNILTENPTFFDSLYEAELARPEGARPEALDVFLQFEIGIKGAGREEIISEIRGLLGHKRVTAEQVANENKLRLQQRDEMAARTEENKLLQDAPRVRALAQRNEDIAAVKKAGHGKADQSAARPLMMDSQRRETADHEGIDIGQGGGDEGRVSHPTTPAKPDGETHPETQQPGERPLAPKKGRGGKKAAKKAKE